MNERGPSRNGDGPTLDMREVFALIGEYEVMKRMMSADMARLRAENQELRAQLAEASPTLANDG